MLIMKVTNAKEERLNASEMGFVLVAITTVLNASEAMMYIIAVRSTHSRSHLENEALITI